MKSDRSAQRRSLESIMEVNSANPVAAKTPADLLREQIR
jgi:hypothetical protein